jgi:hypothetical protein
LVLHPVHEMLVCWVDPFFVGVSAPVIDADSLVFCYLEFVNCDINGLRGFYFFELKGIVEE